MKYIINSGIYEINWDGKNEAEFMGNHPTLILKSIKNKQMYYIFPLTTYTDERWEKYRKLNCCRITSTNSIVRIDKVKVLHRLQIKNRWIRNDMFIIPTPEEVKVVYQKYIEYITTCVDVSVSDYRKYYKNYNKILDMLYESFVEYNFSDDLIFNFNENTIEFNLNLVSKLTFDDIKHIIYSILGKENVSVAYSKDKLIVTIIVTNKNLLLTIKEQYDIFNSTKGNANKTSVKIC